MNGKENTSAGDVLENFYPNGNPGNQTAGEILMSYVDKPVFEKIDRVITSEEFLQILGEDSIGNAGDTVDGDESHKTPEWSETTDFRYRMNHRERGCFMIFNQEVFDIKTNLTLDERIGSSTDARNLASAAAYLGFEYIQVFNNLTRSKILEWLKNVAAASHESYDCFGCAILTHGDENNELYARDASMNITDFTNPFTADKCPTLAGKPKLFFVQACRGHKRDIAVPFTLSVAPTIEQAELKLIPSQADFLIASSTPEGYSSWRNKANGSWFIQALYLCIQRYPTLEIMQIMTRVNRMVALHFGNTNSESQMYKQIPSVCTRLTGELYFHKPGSTVVESHITVSTG
ncbi:caspase-3-like [Ciona intestinalis]